MSTQIPVETLRLHIRSTLQLIALWSPAAEELLLGTAAQESHLGYYRRQVNGPARGIYQMEPETERSLWIDSIAFRPALAVTINHVCGISQPYPPALEFNLAYQTIMARLRYYLWVKEPIPAADNLRGQAAYWKRNYNTAEGAGTVSEYLSNYRKYVLCENIIAR